MTDVRYIYRVNISEFSGNVSVAIYDPERWDGQGGARFGYVAEVYITSEWNVPDSSTRHEAGVNMSAIGTHTPDDAELRIDVYQQATDIARFINNELAEGVTLQHIGAYLTETLKPGTPVTNRFSYPAVKA